MQVPEIIGYVLERHLPAMGATLTISTTDPSLGESVERLIRLSEHESIVAGLENELSEAVLKHEDAAAVAKAWAIARRDLQRAGIIDGDVSLLMLAMCVAGAIEEARKGAAGGGAS